MQARCYIELNMWGGFMTFSHCLGLASRFEVTSLKSLYIFLWFSCRGFDSPRPWWWAWQHPGQTQGAQQQRRVFSRCCKLPPEGSTYWQCGEETCLSTFSLPASVSATGLSFPADDPELWDFTLDGIEELDVPAGGPPSRVLRPSTPGNHQMQTRSKTPQRAAGRPPDEAPSNSGGQDRAQFRPHTGQGEVLEEELLIC